MNQEQRVRDLEDALEKTRAILMDGADGAVTDTIWLTPEQTLCDFIDAVLEKRPLLAPKAGEDEPRMMKGCPDVDNGPHTGEHAEQASCRLAPACQPVEEVKL
jgi:hypothetical protein